MQFFSDYDICKHVMNITRTGVTTVEGFLCEKVRQALLEELETLPKSKAESEYGPHGVRQNFEHVFNFPPSSLFLTVRNQFQDNLNKKLEGMSIRPVSRLLTCNDVVVQIYPPRYGGISPHRDVKRSENLIAVMILEGSGSFCTCSDRKGSNSILHVNNPGDLLLMRGPGFMGSDDGRPFHFVENITSKRSSLALRDSQERWQR